MGKIKKVLALVIAMVVMTAMALPTMAEPTNTTLKVEAVEGHTYTGYQLLVGDLAADGKTLSNVKWGANAAGSIVYKTKDSNGTFTIDKTLTTSKDGEVPADFLEYFASLENNKQATADIVSGWVTGTGFEVTSTATSVLTGYYVVKDAYTDPAKPQETTLSTVMAQVVSATTITPKAGTTSHKKEVLDVNDTTETALDLSNLQNIKDGWDKTADHDFGDHVPFKLTTTIGSDFAKYESYYLAVNDTLSDGLILDANTIKVYVDGTLATNGTGDGQYNLSTPEGGKSFTVTFNKLNGNANAAAGKDVVVYYTATLDGATAKIGNPGNLNESYAEFSNNPNGTQEGKGKTPTSTALVFTYKTDVDKITSTGDALPKAGFTLYKKYNAAVTDKTNVAGTTPAGAKSDTFPANEYWYEVKTIAASDSASFEFGGIDDGTYILVESVTPDGYNTMDPVTIVVTATHGTDTSADRGYSITALNVDNADFKADPKGGEIRLKKNSTNHTLVSGEIYSEIVNNSGSTLPSTGGMGTTIFYVIGGILVLAAAIILISKRRVQQ